MRKIYMSEMLIVYRNVPRAISFFSTNKSKDSVCICQYCAERAASLNRIIRNFLYDREPCPLWSKNKWTYLFMECMDLRVTTKPAIALAKTLNM